MDESIFGCQHPPGHVGRIDDPHQRFSREERELAELAAGEGHDVTAVKRDKKSRTPDADICGHKTEFKRLDPEGSTTPDSRIRNSLSRAESQGTHVIVDARADSRTTRGDVDVGVRKFLSSEAERKSTGALRGEEKAAIRVVAKDFDVSYHPARVRQMRQEQTSQLHAQPPNTAAKQEQPPTKRFSIDRTGSRDVQPNREPPRNYDLTRNQDREESRRPKGPSK